jgi:hypothetical protein
MEKFKLHSKKQLYIHYNLNFNINIWYVSVLVRHGTGHGANCQIFKIRPIARIRWGKSMRDGGRNDLGDRPLVLRRGLDIGERPLYLQRLVESHS